MLDTLERTPSSHLVYEERCQIHTLLKIGCSQRSIARDLGVHPSTICKEIARNKGGCGYRYKQAHDLCTERREKASATSSKMIIENKTVIIEMLEDTQASPQQISGCLRKKGILDISHESIYRMIWADKRSGGELYMHLRHKAKKYNKRGGKTAGRGCIPNRIDIDQRPDIVEKKERFGDFELDTIVGAHHQGSIVSMVDRASKITCLRLLQRGTSKAVKDALIEGLKPFSKEGLVETLTSDNGKEFAAHEEVSRETGGDFYFAKPYHSWERGLNEHTNGLVRQYFPKGTNFTTLTEKEVADVERKLNNRPRATLDFDTPKERLLKLCPNLKGIAFHC